MNIKKQYDIFLQYKNNSDNLKIEQFKTAENYLDLLIVLTIEDNILDCWAEYQKNNFSFETVRDLIDDYEYAVYTTKKLSKDEYTKALSLLEKYTKLQNIYFGGIDDYENLKNEFESDLDTFESKYI
jgi:hypothetical protein